MAGWVYILSNPAMPGLFKVGYTDRDPFSRAKEISQATGVPFDFIVEYQIYVSHPYELEQKTHKLLHNHRVNNNREFFNCSYEDVVETIRVAINDLYKHIDNFVFGSESSYKTEKDILEKKLIEKQNAIKKALEEKRFKIEQAVRYEKEKLDKFILSLEREEKQKIAEIEKKFVKPPFVKELIATIVITALAFGIFLTAFLPFSLPIPGLLKLPVAIIYYYIPYKIYKKLRTFLPEFADEQKQNELKKINALYKTQKQSSYVNYEKTINQIKENNQ
ncbi:MAG: GIY-YIG nuclease family protein [Haemophilus haemolyticus]|nr:GIY-YIG nuclease family protein [Haemophilus haemolyticus]